MSLKVTYFAFCAWRTDTYCCWALWPVWWYCCVPLLQWFRLVLVAGLQLPALLTRCASENMQGNTTAPAADAVWLSVAAARVCLWHSAPECLCSTWASRCVHGSHCSCSIPTLLLTSCPRRCCLRTTGASSAQKASRAWGRRLVAKGRRSRACACMPRSGCCIHNLSSLPSSRWKCPNAPLLLKHLPVPGKRCWMQSNVRHNNSFSLMQVVSFRCCIQTALSCTQMAQNRWQMLSLAVNIDLSLRCVHLSLCLSLVVFISRCICLSLCSSLAVFISRCIYNKFNVRMATINFSNADVDDVCLLH